MGLTLNPDRSEDQEFKIRDLPDVEIGDYTRRDEEVITVDHDRGKFHILYNEPC